MERKNYNDSSYDTEAVRLMIMEEAVNDPKAKGKKPSTPNSDGITSDIKAMSITQDVDGSVFSASFHDNPLRFYSFVLPDEVYEMFEHFKRHYSYMRTPKKRTVNKSAFEGLMKVKKPRTTGGSELLEGLE